MAIKAFFFNRNANGRYDPVLLIVKSITRDGQGTGTVVVILPNGQIVTLHTQYDPGQIVAGATFYATIEPGNRSILIPYKQVYVSPAHAAIASEGAKDLQEQVKDRIVQLHDLLRMLKASPVPSPQLLASAKGMIQMLFPFTAGVRISVVPVRRVQFAQSNQGKHKSRPWRAELRAPETDSSSKVVDAFRDTGAEINCIADLLARQLKLPEIGLVDITGITSVPQRMPRVKVHVTLPKYGIAEEVEAAIVPDLVARCGREFLIGDQLSEKAEESMGVL